MFETKINSIIDSKKPEIDKDFLMDARGIQVCNVIDSLTGEEFFLLQKSILASFDAVQTLNDIVKEGIKNGQSYIAIYNTLNEAYLESAESSFYYRRMYLKLCNVLVTFCDILNSDGKDITSLLDSFSKSIEEPFDSERKGILKAIFTRKELKNRIVQNANIQNEEIVTQQELENINSVNQLYEQIREMLLQQVQDEQVKEKLKNAPPSFIDVALVQPMIVLKNHLSIKEEEKNIIASILERSKKEYHEMSANASKSKISINIMTDKLLHSFPEQKEALDQLLKLLTAIPGDDFQWEIYFLNQVRESSNWTQRKFYSGKNFRYPSMKDETRYYEKTVSEFTSDILEKLDVYYSQCQRNINEKAVNSINSAFQSMMSGLSYVHDSIKLYKENADLSSLSSHPLSLVMLDIVSLKEYLALKNIFSQFFERLLHGALLKEIVDYFGQEESEINSDKKDFMRSIAKFIWDTPMLNHSVADVNQSQLDLYNELRGVRKVQEDEIIDTIIGGPVYKKTTNN